MNRKIQVRFLEGKGGVIRPTYSILLEYYEIEDLKILRNFKLISLKNKVINTQLNSVLELLKKSIIEEKELKN